MRNFSSIILHVSAVFLVLLLGVRQGTDAFLPRPSSSHGSSVAPWGVRTTTTTKPASNGSAQTLSREQGGPLSYSTIIVPPAALLHASRATPLHAATQTGISSGSTAAPKIVIAGAPASGKGTQCEKIREKFGVVHLSTGDMLRAAVAAGTEVGNEAKAYMDSGKLVPDSTIIGVVKDRLAQEDCQTNGWLLDGFPRTQAQAQALADAGIQADCFIFLNVPDDVLVERVVGRRTDPATGKIYHMTFSPPADAEVLGRLEQRSDDTEEKVKVRLEQFHANVDAVKDSYTDIAVTIDGNQKPETVSNELFEAIDKLLVKA